MELLSLLKTFVFQNELTCETSTHHVILVSSNIFQENVFVLKNKETNQNLYLHRQLKILFLTFLENIIIS